MRRAVVRGLHVASVVLSFLLVLEGPDLLLLAVRDVDLWLPVGVASALLTLPVLRRWGVGLVPPWSMPAYAPGASLRRAGGYHLLCGVLVAWLWTYPTLRAVAWIHDRRGLAATVGTLPTDAVSVAGGLLLAELLFFLPALVVVVRLSAFRTDVDLHEARAGEVFRPAVAALGSYLLTGFVVSVLSFLATAP
jgi:hypothetical protein